MEASTRGSPGSTAIMSAGINISLAVIIELRLKTGETVKKRGSLKTIIELFFLLLQLQHDSGRGERPFSFAKVTNFVPKSFKNGRKSAKTGDIKGENHTT